MVNLRIALFTLSMADLRVTTDSEPAIMGCIAGVASAASSQAVTAESAPPPPSSGGCLPNSLIAILCIAVSAVLVGGYISSCPWCIRFGCSRFERFAWGSPLYVFGPGSAVALISLFLHRHDRISSESCLHKWTWRFGIFNLMAALSCAITLLLNECHTKTSSWDTRCEGVWSQGRFFEGVWILCYACSEGMLLRLVQRKVHVLAQRSASRQLTFLFSFMFVMLVLSFVPCLVWERFNVNPLRWVFASCYMCGFIVGSFIATRAMLNAVSVAELLLVKKLPCESKSKLDAACSWTRWTAYATLISMVTSILNQGALCVWMELEFPANGVRYLCDWLQALDFSMNAWCAASLACMLGKRTDPRFADASLDEVGDLLPKAVADDAAFLASSNPKSDPKVAL